MRVFGASVLVGVLVGVECVWGLSDDAQRHVDMTHMTCVYIYVWGLSDEAQSFQRVHSPLHLAKGWRGFKNGRVS